MGGEKFFDRTDANPPLFACVTLPAKMPAVVPPSPPSGETDSVLRLTPAHDHVVDRPKRQPSPRRRVEHVQTVRPAGPRRAP